jgi:hypothetical protein
MKVGDLICLKCEDGTEWTGIVIGFEEEKWAFAHKFYTRIQWSDGTLDRYDENEVVENKLEVIA